ncbi:MAG TPA: universal stress protein [Solirubrobacteraceae bacterium]|nr:universal stress protein [Solirubrobacteraceae bacterium]
MAEGPAHTSCGPCFVLGYDRSESARRAAHWALGELLPDGKLVLVHSSRSLHAPASPLSTQQERAQLGRAILDELLLEGDQELFDVAIATEISEEDPVTALLQAAERHDARAIVVGHEHRSRLRRALGSVTSELLRTSPLPVIAVPANGATAT